MSVAIIDYDVCNVGSILNMMNGIGVPTTLASAPVAIEVASAVTKPPLPQPGRLFGCAGKHRVVLITYPLEPEPVRVAGTPLRLAGKSGTTGIHTGE